ncbi:unnamed protein product, partial [Amoebophrya sp. A25]
CVEDRDRRTRTTSPKKEMNKTSSLSRASGQQLHNGNGEQQDQQQLRQQILTQEDQHLQTT